VAGAARSGHESNSVQTRNVTVRIQEATRTPPGSAGSASCGYIAVLDNVFDYVQKGIVLLNTPDADESRALILRNSMNLRRRQSGDTVDPIGIDLSGFDEAICRNSLIAADPDDPNAADTTDTMIGIRFTSVDAVTVAANIISECTEQNSVAYSSCGTVDSFDNRAGRDIAPCL
jgi:hypothetical protein